MMPVDHLKDLIDRQIEKLALRDGWNTQLYEPMSYLMGLKGKRIRPILFLMTYGAIHGSIHAAAVDSALSLELFHNFTLMHDDIMDHADLRRGQPTVHRKWDVNTAILSGDAMFAVALEFLVRGFSDRAAPLVREFTRVSLGVCEGQMEDLLLSGNPQASVPEYMEMIRKKTAMLLGGALSLGAIAAGAEEYQVREFYDLGESAGIGFQLQDDYLDAYAPSSQTGKRQGGDILERKMTYLLIRALEKSNETQRKELERLLFEVEDAEVKVNGVLGLYEELGVGVETERRVDEYFRKANAILRHLGGDFPLGGMEQFLVNLQRREH